VASEHDDWNGRRDPPQTLQKFDPTQAWHYQICEYNRGLKGGDGRERNLTISRCCDRKAISPKGSSKKSKKRVIIVYKKEAHNTLVRAWRLGRIHRNFLLGVASSACGGYSKMSW
jgi:hypothetical protein